MHHLISGRRGLAALTRALLLCSSLTAIGFAASPAAAAPDPAAVFLSHHYNACDAQILANYWQVDFVKAKVMAGQKITGGNNSTLHEVLNTARSQSHCDWVDIGLNYNDALALSKYWGDTTDQAKAKIVTFYSQGQVNLAKQALRAARHM